MDIQIPVELLNFLINNLNIIINLAVLALIAWIFLRLVALLSNRIKKNIIAKEIEPERLTRVLTLENVLITSLRGLVLVTFVLSVLGILGFNLAPLLASAGIAGLAVSLGAQTLIKDFISGFLIIFENQFGVGDFVQIGNVKGTVERITLRTVVVRDYSGSLNIIPNGEIRVVTNSSRDWARARVHLNIPFDADVGIILQALESAVRETEQEESIREKWIENPTLIAYSGANDWGVQIRLTGRVQIGHELTGERLLRQYALENLRKRGISLAIPAQEIHLPQEFSQNGDQPIAMEQPGISS